MKRNVVALVGILGLVGGGWWLRAQQQSHTPIVVKSIYNETIEPVEIQPVFVSELAFLKETLTIATTSGRLPQSWSEYDPEKLKQYEAKERERATGVEIPAALHQLYLSTKAQATMMHLMQRIRQEYLTYARIKQTRPEYIEAIEALILPEDEDRLVYVPTRKYPDLIKTHTRLYGLAPQRDYSQLQIVVCAGDVYNLAQEIAQATLLPAPNPELERDMALRYVMYHEMTHVLQQAVDVVNAPLEQKTSVLPGLYARRRVLDIDNSYYQQWGTATDSLTRAVNNLTMAKERQAEGVAVDMVGEVYDMSMQQKTRWWKAHFGKLEQAKQDSESIMAIMNDYYPQENVETWIHGLKTALIDRLPGKATQEPKATVIAMHSRLDGLMSTHWGYLHPMTHDEVRNFWRYVEQ